MTREEALEIQKSISYWANNCGGCETCEREFGNREEPTFDMQTVYEIISVYEDLLKEKETKV
jgi:Ni,Fe-hydrogenase III small subunit